MPDESSTSADLYVLRLGRYQLKLGLRTGIALVLAAAIIVLGILVSPGNLLAGVLTGISGLLGAVLGVLVDIRPVAASHGAEALGAVRKLQTTALAVEDVQTTLQQVASLPKNVRIDVAIASAQNDLERVRLDLFESMGEWEQISPGTGEAARQVRLAGSEMLKRMTEEQGSGGLE